MYGSIMCDLETLSADDSKQCVIASIALVAFNLEEQESFDEIKEDTSRYLMLRPDLEEQQDAGLGISTSTVKWWMTEPTNEARLQTFRGSRSSMAQAIHDIDEFIKELEPDAAHFTKRRTKLWGNGNVFDNCILRNFYNAASMPFPLPFWNDLDLRTLKYIARTIDWRATDRIAQGTKNNVKHSALDDAIQQVCDAQSYYQIINGS